MRTRRCRARATSSRGDFRHESAAASGLTLASPANMKIQIVHFSIKAFPEKACPRLEPELSPFFRRIGGNVLSFFTASLRLRS
jgi:hypothetical protein